MNVYQMLAYESVRTFLGPWYSLAFSVQSEGLENVPEEGGAMLFCNHRSSLDQLALMYEVDRFVHFVAGSRGLVFPLARTFSRMTGMVRVPTAGGKRGGSGRGEVVRLLKDGEPVCMFPEGVGSFMRLEGEGDISYFRTDFVRMALEAEVPVIPVAVISREYEGPPRVAADLLGKQLERSPAVNRAARLFPTRKVLLRIGRPISLGGFSREDMTKSDLNSLTGKLRRVVLRLYKGEELDRFLTGKIPFDIYTDRV